MSLIDNVKNCIGRSDSPDLTGFRLISFNFNSAYFEDIKQIISYAKEEIVLGLKKGRLSVKGSELYVKKYCAGDVVICGAIKSIEKF